MSEAFEKPEMQHLHADEDERPPIPSASSHETPFERENTSSEMEVDRDS